MYENNKTYNVIKGKVPDFSVSDGDIILAITMNNKKISGFTFPNKDVNYKVNQVICEDGVTADFDVTVWGLINIQNPNQANMIKCTIDFKGWEYEYTGEEQKFTAPLDGNYKIELWGAQGVGTLGGLGAYVSGEINLKKGEAFLINVGNQGQATDVRTDSSLLSRIMVAASGGGEHRLDECVHGLDTAVGGAAGGLIGYSGASGSMGFKMTREAQGGTQTSGGLYGYGNEGNGYSGGFGTGGAPQYVSGNYPGGSGYYGGGGSGRAACNGGSGGGGSSFISGHEGCDAISKESTLENIIHTGTSIHFSGYKFTNTKMIDGAGYYWTTEKKEKINMPTHDGTENTMVGNTGNGYARITYLGK